MVRSSGVGTVATVLGRLGAVVLGASFGAGCAGSPEASPRAVSAAPILAHAAGGWLEHARSPIVPFCQGVLIAPDVVVSSARCVDEGWYELSFGVGDVGGETIPVVAASRHPLAAEGPEHALVALVLERAVAGVEPARLEMPDEAPCGVELPTYRAAARGEASERDVWVACALEPGESLDTDARFVAVEGFPSCHGESGAGAFVPGGRDDVIGWVTSAGRDGPPHPDHEICVTSVGLATVHANVAWLERARARSRVEAPF